MNSTSLWNNSDNNNRAHDFLFRSESGSRYIKGRVADDMPTKKRHLINRHKDGEISAIELKTELTKLS